MTFVKTNRKIILNAPLVKFCSKRGGEGGAVFNLKGCRLHHVINIFCTCHLFQAAQWALEHPLQLIVRRVLCRDKLYIYWEIFNLDLCLNP